ncbi:hypothetical protein GCM10023144_01410 [Pigmentiphaga soli]|uniref:DUF1376 domain-containing protein n=1 Tax=Pigmentiphaga soli TaxID=1007095 RepID=A0ABP8GCL3_9BURK
MNYYKRHLGDYAAATRHLSMIEHGAYTLLLDVYYVQERPLPADERAIWRLVAARSKDEREAVSVVLQEFFVLAEDGWHQPRCDEEISKKQVKAEQNREIGKRGGRPKKETQAEAGKNPNGFHEETETVSEKNPSHKPLANNQENISPQTPPAGSEHPDSGPDPARVDPPAALPSGTPYGAMSGALRKVGVTVTGSNPILQAWVADGYLPADLLEAVEIARVHKPAPEPIAAGYVDKVLRGQANGKPSARGKPAKGDVDEYGIPL